MKFTPKIFINLLLVFCLYFTWYPIILIVSEFFTAWYSGVPYEQYMIVPMARYLPFLSFSEVITWAIWNLIVTYLLLFLMGIILPFLFFRKAWMYKVWMVLLGLFVFVNIVSFCLSALSFKWNKSIHIHDQYFQTDSNIFTYLLPAVIFAIFLLPAIKSQFVPALKPNAELTVL